ncbi:MAG: hypothetical protein RB296_12530 [Acidobacteriota bacterium]|jgi:hypothetical protein|nr:hypothetical protein [Acidobacteriota bacterium]
MKKASLLSFLVLAGTLLVAQNVTLTSPNGGESWRKGTHHNITWMSSGIIAGTYQITLWRGGTSLGVVASGVPYTQNAFEWIVGKLVNAADAAAGPGYTIKLRLQGETPNDFSNNTFTIAPAFQQAGPAGSIETLPDITRAEQPPFQVLKSPKLEVQQLIYDYRNKRFQARVRNVGNAPFVGYFRWEWATCCGGRSANKDIPPAQSALLDSLHGMHLGYDCDPPIYACDMEAHFSIYPITQEGTNLAPSQISKHLPRYEHCQFLMGEEPILLRFLHGSVSVNRNQGHTLNLSDTFDYDPVNRTATFDVGIGIHNCGGDAGTSDHFSGLSLYWSVHHWPSNTYTLQPQRFISPGRITSPIQPGQGMLIERPLTLPIRSGRYELRVHMGSAWPQGQVCSIYLTFAENLVD